MKTKRANGKSTVQVVLGADSARTRICRVLRRIGSWLGVCKSPPRVDMPSHLPDFSFSIKGGRYTDAREITRGGMGSIHSVWDRDLKRQTAMKVALPAVLARSINASRFVNEARTTARLEHPNIVPVHDIGFTPEEGLYYTMKLIEGEALSNILDDLYDGNEERHKQFSLHRLLIIFRDVCEAVAFAHSKDIIHMDIKPENIMVGQFGEVQLMDWGIAQRLAGKPTAEGRDAMDDVEKQVRASTGEIRGTPAYMAPEQALGYAAELDERTDIFLLGGCLYHILTLAPPYLGADPNDVMDSAAAYEGIEPPNDRAPGRQIPRELSEITMKALAEHKNNRYQTVDQLVNDLDRYMGGQMLTRTRHFDTGDTLMHEEETGHEAYVITSGQVDVYRGPENDRVLLTTLGPGDTVGEMSMLTGEPRSATVVAREPTEVNVITEDLMDGALRKMPPWLSNAVDALAERLRIANTRMQSDRAKPNLGL